MTREYDGTGIEELRTRGYARVSNKYRIIARVDNPEWVLKESKRLPKMNWADHQRRVYSKDCMIVPDAVFKVLPPSDSIEIGYEVDGAN